MPAASKPDQYLCAASQSDVGIIRASGPRERSCRAHEGPMKSIQAVITRSAAAAALLCLLCSTPAMATPFTFSTGNPDGLMATATRPGSAGNIEIESADDFVLTGPTTIINSATFTGLLTGGTT